MNCEICSKPLKENTEGNNRYCQGHSIFEVQQNDCRHLNTFKAECLDCKAVLIPTI